MYHYVFQNGKCENPNLSSIFLCFSYTQICSTTTNHAFCILTISNKSWRRRLRRNDLNPQPFKKFLASSYWLRNWRTSFVLLQPGSQRPIARVEGSGRAPAEHPGRPLASAGGGDDQALGWALGPGPEPAAPPAETGGPAPWSWAQPWLERGDYVRLGPGTGRFS